VLARGRQKINIRTAKTPREAKKIEPPRRQEIQ